MVLARSRHDDTRATLAQQFLAELEPSLSKLTIQTSSAPELGLRVSLDSEALNEAKLGIEFPVDPGEHVLEATAPGHSPWSTRFFVPSSMSTQIQIPALTPLPRSAPVATAAASSSGADPGISPRAAATGGSDQLQKTLGLSLLGGGTALVVTGSILSFEAYSKSRAADAYCSSGSTERCASDGVEQLRASSDMQLAANITLLIGSAAIVSGATTLVWWATQKSGGDSRSAIRVVPVANQSLAGVVVGGSF